MSLDMVSILEYMDFHQKEIPHLQVPCLEYFNICVAILSSSTNL